MMKPVLSADIKGSDAACDVALLAVPTESLSADTLGSLATVATLGRLDQAQGGRTGDRDRECARDMASLSLRG